MSSDLEGKKPRKPKLEVVKGPPPPGETEKIDPRAMLDALGKNDMYTNKPKGREKPKRSYTDAKE